MMVKRANKENDSDTHVSHPKRYTIFHALFDAMKDKDEKHKK